MALINSSLPAAVLSLKKIEKKYPIARDIMNTCAFLHPAEIPYEIIFEAILESCRFPLGKGRAWIVSDVFPMLRGYYMMRLDQVENLAWVHESTSAAVRATMSDEERQSNLNIILCAMERIFPADHVGSGIQCARLIHHACVLLRFAAYFKIGPHEAGERLRLKACNYLDSRGRQDDADALRVNCS